MNRNSLLILLTLSSWTSHGQTLSEVTKDSLRTVICNLLSKDQQYRAANDAGGKPQKELDSINFHQLTAITKKFGYPDEKRIGKNDCGANPFIILLHNPDRLMEKEPYDLYMLECKKGNIGGWELGQALDRYYVHFQKKSMYGLYGRDSKPCLEDIETVNRNRKELGLVELKEDKFKTCR